MADSSRLSSFLGTTTALTGGSPPSPFLYPPTGRSGTAAGDDGEGDDLDDLEPTGPIRMISATVGALITSFVVTPFDVIKTRLQAQLHLLHPQQASGNSQRTPPPSSSSSHSASHLHSHRPLYLHDHSPLVSHPQAHSSYYRPLAVSVVRGPHLSPSALLESCSHTRLPTGLTDSWCDRCVVQPSRLSPASASTLSLTHPPPPPHALHWHPRRPQQARPL